MKRRYKCSRLVGGNFQRLTNTRALLPSSHDRIQSEFPVGARQKNPVNRGAGREQCDIECQRTEKAALLEREQERSYCNRVVRIVSTAV